MKMTKQPNPNMKVKPVNMVPKNSVPAPDVKEHVQFKLTPRPSVPYKKSFYTA